MFSSYLTATSERPTQLLVAGPDKLLPVFHKLRLGHTEQFSATSGFVTASKLQIVPRPHR